MRYAYNLEIQKTPKCQSMAEISPDILENLISHFKIYLVQEILFLNDSFKHLKLAKYRFDIC